MIMAWLRGLRRAGKRPAARNLHRFRPFLEVLEDRWVPAVDKWVGGLAGTPTDATKDANWSLGRVPTANDEAVFDNTATNDFWVPANGTLTVGKLTAAATFSQHGKVEGTLKVLMGNVAGDSTWAAPSNLLLNGAASRIYVMGNGNMIFSNGAVGTLDTLGTVEVDNGATLKLTSLTVIFSANLTVGDGTTAGTFEMGGLVTDVATTKGASITVTSTGTFKMTQTGDTSSSKGGLYQVLGQGETAGTFTNQGIFIRDGLTTGVWDVQLDYVLTNTGTFQVKQGSTIRFPRKDADGYSLINTSPGVVDLYFGAYVKSDNKFKQTGGENQTNGGPGGGGSVFFYMTSDFLGGSLNVDRDGGFGTLEFGTHDVKFAGSLFIYMEVDGSSPALNPVGDQINLGGGATLTIDNSGTSKPTLVVTTLNATPPAGWSFNLINTPNLVGTFNTVTFQGNFTPQNGYTVTYPAGPPRQVRITA